MNYRKEIEMYRKALMGEYDTKRNIIKESTEEQTVYLVILEHPAGHKFYTENEDPKLFNDLKEAKQISAQIQLEKGYKCWVGELKKH